MDFRNLPRGEELVAENGAKVQEKSVLMLQHKPLSSLDDDL